jgi:hypothetical protein
VQKKLSRAARAKNYGFSENLARRAQNRVEKTNADASAVGDNQTFRIGKRHQKMFFPVGRAQSKRGRFPFRSNRRARAEFGGANARLPA